MGRGGQAIRNVHAQCSLDGKSAVSNSNSKWRCSVQHTARDTLPAEYAATGEGVVYFKRSLEYQGVCVYGGFGFDAADARRRRRRRSLSLIMTSAPQPLRPRRLVPTIHMRENVFFFFHPRDHTIILCCTLTQFRRYFEMYFTLILNNFKYYHQVLEYNYRYNWQFCYLINSPYNQSNSVI